MTMMSELNLKLLFLVLVLTKLAGRNSGEFASLSLSQRLEHPVVNESYCAVYNPSYSSLPTGKQAEPDVGLFHPGVILSDSMPLNPLGCSDMPADLVAARSVIVERGNCSFYCKAINAQEGQAAGLLVVYNESIGGLDPTLDPDPDCRGEKPIRIPVVFVSSETGEELQSWLSSSLLYLSVFIPSSPPIDPGSVVLFCIAVGTVLLAAFLANIPFQFLRYGLLLRKGVEYPSNEGEGSTSKKMTVISMLFGLVFMVSATCALLLLLYFFYSPMVYIVLALYCVASVFGLYSLLSPFVALIPLGEKWRVPPNKIPILKYEPNILFFVTVIFCVGVVLWWVVERHSIYAWILQDILGFAFITMLLSRLRFLKVWFVAALMLLLFLYDIFMVFVTPYFTHDGVSVMEKAATGPAGGGTQELLPVVFLVPKLLYPSPLEALCKEYIRSRPASLLGYGDVGIPGLLVTLCYKFDVHFRKGKWFKIYYATCGIAYIVGLAITYLALALMQTAQPALLYLVPTTLGSVTLLSLFRKEFTLFFTNTLSGHDHDLQVQYTPKRSRTPDKPIPKCSISLEEAEPAIGAESALGTESIIVVESAIGAESDSDTESEVHIIQEERQALISSKDEPTEA